MLVGQLPDPLQVAVRGRHQPHVRRQRLGQDRGYLALAQRRRQRIGVVPRHHHGVRRLRRRDPGAGRDALSRQARAGVGEQAVDVAVVGARELHDRVPARGGPRQAHGAHRRLGARRRHPQHLDRAEAVGYLGRQLDFRLGRRAVGRPLLGGVLHRLDHVGVRVAQDQRPPRADPVHVAVAVHVDQLEALAALDEDRMLAADRAHRPDRRVHAARQEPRGSRVDDLGRPGVRRLRVRRFPLGVVLGEVVQADLLELGRGVEGRAV